MKRIPTELKDCFIIEPDKFGADRGYFSPYFIQDNFDKELEFAGVVQTNRSMSSKGVLRGLHFQVGDKCQTKIVEVIHGAAIDVVVDIRKGSPTFGKSTSVLLTQDNNRQLFVPRGFAHGFISLKDDTVFQYLIDNDYAPSLEGGILWNDPKFNINWDEIFKEYEIDSPSLSEKDKLRKMLGDENNYFLYKEGNLGNMVPDYENTYRDYPSIRERK